MSKDWEKFVDNYCTCGAKHGTIDGTYKCTNDCLTTEFKDIVAKQKKELRRKYQMNKTSKEILETSARFTKYRKLALKEQRTQIFKEVREKMNKE